MKTSPAGLRFLEANEGVRLDVYLDESGIPTVGVGHVVRAVDGLVVGGTITQAQCDAFLAADVANTEAAINGLTNPALTQNQFDALVSLTFNIGVNAFRTSTVLRDLNAGLIADERRAFELWDKDMQNGSLVISPALLARRDREVALFLKPDDA